MRKLFPVLLVIALVAGACSKDHQCKCDVTDEGVTNKLQFLTVDKGLKCEDITEMAIEKQIVDSVTGDHTLTRMEVYHLRCREYAENN